MWKDDGWLLDILNNARQLVALTDNRSRQDFERDTTLQRAIFWHFVVIGEAARKVSPEFKQKHPEIPWNRMTGLRNVLVHQYFAIKLDLVWEAATLAIPALIVDLDRIVPPNTDTSA